MTGVIICLFIAGIIIGYKRGFVKSAYKLVATLIALVAAYALTPLAANIISQNTQWDDHIHQAIYEQFEQRTKEKLREELGTQLQANGITLTDEMLDTQFQEYMQTVLDVEKLSELLKTLGIPDFMKTGITQEVSEHSAAPLLERVYDEIAAYLTSIILQALAYMITFVVINLVLLIIYMSLVLVTHLPVLGTLNRMAGSAFGFLQVLLYVWIFFAIVELIAATQVGNSLYEQIYSSDILMRIQEVNPFAIVVKTLAKSIM